MALVNQAQRALSESVVEDSQNLSIQIKRLEQRLAELSFLVEDDTLIPDKDHQRMLDFLRELHFT